MTTPEYLAVAIQCREPKQINDSNLPGDTTKIKFLQSSLVQVSNEVKKIHLKESSFANNGENKIEEHSCLSPEQSFNIRNLVGH